MPTLEDIREGLAANLAGIPGLQQSGYLLSNPTPPFAEIYPDWIAYDLAMGRGLDRWNLVVRVGVSLVTDVGAQKRLDKFIASAGATSIKAAIESDKTLDGLVDNVRVTRCDAYRVFERQGSSAVLGAEWQVEVLATGAT